MSAGADLSADGRFRAAIETVLRHEGGGSDDPDDPGGPTAYGISLRYLKGLGDIDGDGYAEGDLDGDGDVDANDIRLLDRDAAIALYRSQWWDRYRYERLHLMIGIKVFDLAVNMGAGTAHICLQRAVRAAGHRPIAEDGVIGSETLLALHDSPRAALLAGIRAEAAGHYRLLIARNRKLAAFEAGWLKRAYD